jgi:hypothetical protein
MSFQAYIDNIRAKTGTTPEDFKRLAETKGLLKPGVKTNQIVSWLKEDFDLGRGHAMAIVLTLKTATDSLPAPGAAIAKHFTGARARFKKPYEELVSTAKTFGPGVSVGPTSSYLSLLHNGKKFAVVQVTGDRMDIGLKLKGVRASRRFEKAGDWNSMVTHRVRITDPEQIDTQVLARLKEAYTKS